MENDTKQTVLLGVTGSIAAYKMADVASDLTKRGFSVETIMTKNATKIIAPIVFSTLTGHTCITRTFDERTAYEVEHISLAKKADILLVAPATANCIAKLATGIADDMLTTTALACTCNKLIAPAMNSTMYKNPIVQENLRKLKKLGWEVIKPDTGILACKEEGIGKLPSPEQLVHTILQTLQQPKDLIGKKVLITAGPTQEPIDPVRFISNHSSGKMGYALAEAALSRGADVTLISGPTHLNAFSGINFIPVTTAEEMYNEVMENSDYNDIIIKAAAVADFTPVKKAKNKLKKSDGLDEISLKSTKDILKALGKQKKPGQFICGFSMETENLLENSSKKLEQKKADMICANPLTEEGAGFDADTNRLALITKDKITEIEKDSKLNIAHKIFDEIVSQI